MECNQVRQLMSAYIDQELDTGQALRMGEHLAHCEACRTALMQAEELTASVRQHATYHLAPAKLRARIVADLVQERPSRFSSWPWAWINLGLSGLSTAAFAVTLTLYLNQPSATQIFNDEVLASHFRSLAPGHLVDVVSSDHHTVKPWYAGKLDFSPPVVDLTAQGYPLLGGRLDYLAGRQVAALAYQHGKHIVNLYLYPDTTNASNTGKAAVSFTTGSSRGYQLMQWSAAGVHYVAVSDMNGAEMAQFAHQIKASVD
ncbi:anti-sigma factor [Undibacterium sp. CY18W]|uniref:Anti-sigma factor n=1 Tax=Undibacterium hunanense TaxID=2762292 RepID=A0ABR6ZXU1_9BURK|nr:anti-sigma factor [Undibacterium hunanense]MBC3920659.1 anti-sigma factor [Undibacterium hunanense]